ncbi:hypothetical protein ABBQ32_005615 [Trebouxia sp. C0010 RCD-2024]
MSQKVADCAIHDHHQTSADKQYRHARLQSVLFHWRCIVYFKRLSHAKQALATSFRQVSVASATFQHWRKLTTTCLYASVAASLQGPVEQVNSPAESGLGKKERKIDLQTDGTPACKPSCRHTVAAAPIKHSTELTALFPTGDSEFARPRDWNSETAAARALGVRSATPQTPDTLQHAVTSCTGQAEAFPKGSSNAASLQPEEAAAPAAHTSPIFHTLSTADEAVPHNAKADAAADSQQLAAETASNAAQCDLSPPRRPSSHPSSGSPMQAAYVGSMQTPETAPQEGTPVEDSPALSTPAAVEAATAEPAAATAEPAAATADNTAVTHEGVGTVYVPTTDLTAAAYTVTGLTPSTAAVGAEAATATDGGLASSDLQKPHESSPAPGSSAEASAAEAEALQTLSSEEGAEGLNQILHGDQPPAESLARTDILPQLTLLSTAASDASVGGQTAAGKLLGVTESPEANALESASNSTLSNPATVAAEGTADPIQQTRATPQLWPPPPESLIPQAPTLSISSHGTPLNRSVSESALQSSIESNSFEPPAQPKRRSLLSWLGPRQRALGVSTPMRTTSDPNLLSSQSFAEMEKLNRPTKRLSLLGLLHRGSSGSATAAVVQSTTVDAFTGPGDSQDSSGAASAAVVQRGQSRTPLRQALPSAEPLLGTITSGGVQSAPKPGLQPQSAPASPMGWGHTGSLGPQGTAVRPDLAMGRTVSDASMLIRLPSGMGGDPATPRRPSLLGRLARGRRSNSIAPEPSPGPMLGQQGPAQGLALQEVPFTEQPFAEQPFAKKSFPEQPSAEQPFAELPSVEEPSPGPMLGQQGPAQGLALQEVPFAEQPFAGQPFAKKSFPEQPFAEQPFAEQPFAEQFSPKEALTEQPSPEQPSAEQPSAEQPSAEQPYFEHSSPAAFLPEEHACAEKPLESGVFAGPGPVEPSWKLGPSAAQGLSKQPWQPRKVLVVDQPEVQDSWRRSSIKPDLAKLTSMDGEAAAGEAGQQDAQHYAAQSMHQGRPGGAGTAVQQQDADSAAEQECDSEGAQQATQHKDAVSPAPFAATSSPLPSTSVSAAEAASEAPSAAASNSEAVPVVPQPESPAEPLCPAQAVTPGVSPATASTARDSTSDTAVIAAPLGQLPPAAVSAVTTPLLTALKAGLLPAAALKPSIQPESLPAVGQFPPQLGSLAAAGGVAAALGGSDSSKQYVTVPVTAQTPIKQDTSTMAESADSEPADSEPALNGESPANLKPPTESPANTPSPTASSSSSSAAGDQSLASCVAPATWPQTVPGAAAAEAQPQPRAGLPPAAAHPIAPALPADSQTSPAAVPGPLEAALRPVEAPEFPATHPGPLEADPRPAKAPLPPAAETGPFNAPSRPEEAPGSPAAGPAPLAAAPMPAEAPGSSAAWSGPPGTALKPVPAGPTAAAPKPLLTKPVRKGRKGKDPDRLSMILQRIADDASPILPQGGIGTSQRHLANQSSDVAAIHVKLDQLIAAYTAANSPGVHTPSQSVFSPAPDRQVPTVPLLNTADSITPGGKAAAGGKAATTAAAVDRAPGSDALSPEPRALGNAPVVLMPDLAAVVAERAGPALKVKVDSSSIADQDFGAGAQNRGLAAMACAPAVAKAAAAADRTSTPAAGKAGAANASQVLPRQSAWDRLRGQAASSSTGTSNGHQTASGPQTDGPAAAAMTTRGVSKALAAQIGGLAGQNDEMVPEPASDAPIAAAAAAAAAATVPDAGHATSAPSTSVSRSAADTGALAGGGHAGNVSVSVPAAKPKRSLKKLLRRVLQ